MKKHWIESAHRWTARPMSYWVHRETGGTPWYEAAHFDPPLPRAVPGKGFPVYHVEVDGFAFDFASLAELDACIETLSRRVLPTSRNLSERRDTDAGPNKHWLSRLPRGTKSWRYRQEAVKVMQAARAEFVAEIEARHPAAETRTVSRLGRKR